MLLESVRADNSAGMSWLQSSHFQDLATSFNTLLQSSSVLASALNPVRR